jgi:hypothetical protein
MAACGGTNEAAPLKELQRTTSGGFDIVLLSAEDGLTHGKDAFVLEFRSRADGTLRDAGAVRANATMPMAGMPPMFGTLELRTSDTPGRYLVSSDLGMAGTWQFNVEWQGVGGTGSTTLRGAVR